MRRSAVAKFPNSVQLFKFCHKVLMDQKGGKVHDQEVGGILNFNPSDCSHWKRGEKNIKSVFALAKLADALGLEISLIHDLAGGGCSLEEAFFEYREARLFPHILKKAHEQGHGPMSKARSRVESFVQGLHEKAELTTLPIYLPEIMRFFPFVLIHPVDMMDRLSRILRKKPGYYTIHFRRGDLKPQTRMSIALDLARIIFEAERGKFPELGPATSDLIDFEEMMFVANLLAPKNLVQEEIKKLDPRKNFVSELATILWVPKALICFQLQDMVRVRQPGERLRKRAETSEGKLPSVVAGARALEG